jgi:hypothetical protein
MIFVAFGKVGFDPGHYAGQNAGPNGYFEGDAMLKLGLKLRETYGSFLTRTDSNDVTFKERTRRAKEAGCNTLISLHSDYPANGVLVLYSVQRPDDQTLAEMIGKEVAAALGISFRRAWARPSTNDPSTDYYGMIRQPITAGIEHAFIVEHGSHSEMSVNTNIKINSLVECYGRILGLKPIAAAPVGSGPVGSTSADKEYQNDLKTVADAVGISYDYWVGRQGIDPYFADLMVKFAKYIETDGKRMIS